MLRDGKLNPDIVGQSIAKLADLFGIKVPSGTKVGTSDHIFPWC